MAAWIAETVSFQGYNGDKGEAYYARPTRAGKFPGVVVIHHIPGWCEWTTEVVRKLAHHGYAAISPHLYFREGKPGEAPDDLGARMRAAGGVADAQVMGDVAGAMAYLRAQPNATGKIVLIPERGITRAIDQEREPCAGRAAHRCTAHGHVLHQAVAGVRASARRASPCALPIRPPLVVEAHR